jgi:hypothetical protein
MVKTGRRIVELERIYGIQRGGNHGNQYTVANSNNFRLPKLKSQLAEELGISERTLDNYKKLTEMIPELEELVDTGMVSPTLALSVIRERENVIVLISQAILIFFNDGADVYKVLGGRFSH